MKHTWLLLTTLLLVLSVHAEDALQRPTQKRAKQGYCGCNQVRVETGTAAPPIELEAKAEEVDRFKVVDGGHIAAPRWRAGLRRPVSRNCDLFSPSRSGRTVKRR